MHSRRRPCGALGQRISFSFVPHDVVDIHGASEGNGDTFVEGRQRPAHLHVLWFRADSTSRDASIGEAEWGILKVRIPNDIDWATLLSQRCAWEGSYY